MKKLILVLPILLLGISCVNTAPNIFFPESFWDREANGYEEQVTRFAENWETALEYPEVRESLKTRLLLGPGKGYRMIDGNELVALSYEKPVLIRHTRGGDQADDGSWNPGCPGSFFHNKFGVYDHVQSLRSDIAVVEIHAQENVGCVPAARLLESWALDTANRLNNEDPELLNEFYKSWGVLVRDRENPELDRWLVVARTPQERSKAIETTACEGWAWQISPFTPFVFRYERGRVVRRNSRYLLLVGNSPPGIFEGHADEEVYETYKKYRKGWFDTEDRGGYSQVPLTESQADAGEHIARGILEALDLL